jgi:hypothetical protein
MHPTKKAGHIAGAIYASMVFVGPFSLMYVPGKLIVRGDATATATNVLAHQTLFGFGIMADMAGAVIFICLAVALYRLLSTVSVPWALLLVGFAFVSAAVGFADTLNNIAALHFFRGDTFLSVFDQAQRDSLGMFFLRLHNQGTFMNEIFWGLWLFPFGLLVYRSGFLPRWIGVWLMTNCFAYLVLSPIGLFFSTFYGTAFKFAQPLLFGEIVTMFWLLIKGAKMPPVGDLSSLSTSAGAQA